MWLRWYTATDTVIKTVPSKYLFPPWDLVSQQTYPVTVSAQPITDYAPSQTTLVSITSQVLLGGVATLTLQSKDNSANNFYSATYVYTLTYTGPTTGTLTPAHSANGLYSASFTPTKLGSYTV